MEKWTSMRAIISAAVASAVLGCATTKKELSDFVRPGEKASIIFPMSNDRESVSDMNAVRISYRVDPPERAKDVVLNTQESILGPIDIRRGERTKFSLRYSISPKATDGSFNIVLLTTMTTPGALSMIGSYDDEGNIEYPPVKIVVKRRRFLWW